MGVDTDQGASVKEPETRDMVLQDREDGSTPRRRVSMPDAACKVLAKDGGMDMMFMVGGWTKDDHSCLVEQFCPEFNEWKSAARLLKQRGQVAVGAVDGEMYALGGEDGVQCCSSVERYDPDTDSWSADVAPLSSPRSGVCVATMDGYLYAIGGHDGIAAINTVERYDPKMNAWTKLAPMLTRRARAAAAVLGDHLYVMGGNDGVRAVNSVEKYNPEDGSWSMCGHMSTPRENAGCAVYLGHVYVAGGRDDLGLSLCSAERLDPDAVRWMPVKCMRSKRDHVSLVVFNGTLLAAGGTDGVSDLKTIELYNSESNTWRHFGSMKSKHPGGRVAVLR
ncbi:uncharacterized protein LOC144195272 [Stigmatopora nigra]